MAAVTIKMTVLLHIRTKPRRPAIHRHLPRQAGTHQCVQAVVNRGHGNLRHLTFGANKNFFSSRMIALGDQNVIHLLTLRCEPEAAGAQSFVDLNVARLFQTGNFARAN